ncbi:MAG: primosome assembly protein PriA, partial [Frankiaceae bacterium]
MTEVDEQLALGGRGGGARRRRSRAPVEPATRLPVARVAVDVPLPHLDRPFDYLVPARLDAAVVPGGRVRVRFAGQLVDGWVLDRAAASDHAGSLAYLAGAPSAEPVLTPEVLRLARAVADRWAGTLADVVRLAVPPRHAAVEAEPPRPPAPPPGGGPVPGRAAWEQYEAGQAFLDALAAGQPARAVWAALPGATDWAVPIAAAVAAALAAGRGAVVVTPDGRDAARVDAALTDLVGSGHHVVLTADLGPRERYRRFLAASRGAVRAVVGTRAAALAPVAGLGLVVVWDDGDDLHAEPRAPYPHARDVLVLRAHLAGAGALVAGHAVTAEGAQLLATGWARPLRAPRSAIRRLAPRVEVPGDLDAARDPAARAARLPTIAWQAARTALAAGAPVLVQVPRRGYQPALACDECRAPARCQHCAGPLGRSGGADAVPA